jgi:selenide, water dikinase
MVGLAAPDDAAVLRLDDDRALIFTTDFFTPIVDDPYHYGAIAAANALSDVYAMGGKPVLALNIAAFPALLPHSMMGTILRGMAEKVREAGAVIGGGHTIKDDEPKVGLAVIGMVDPRKLFTKTGAQPGDVLVLTKPLGTGTIATAGKNDQVTLEDLEKAIGWMTRLNADAALAASKVGARAVTDVTGFGLLGHAIEMAEPAGVSFRFDVKAVPFMDGAQRYAAEGIFPGGSSDNRSMYAPQVRFDAGIPYETQMLLFDAQTSGGLLLAVPTKKLLTFSRVMSRQFAPWWRIGQVLPRGEVAVMVA